jgi:hypothetical protein
MSFFDNYAKRKKVADEYSKVLGRKVKTNEVTIDKKLGITAINLLDLNEVKLAEAYEMSKPNMRKDDSGEFFADIKEMFPTAEKLN